MILISHRGNISGRFERWENEPTYIDNAISKGYDVEIDIWFKNNTLFLGHDEPKYKIDLNFIKDRKLKLWIHCKNIDAIEWFYNTNGFNYFWHEKDTVTLTSHGHIWAYPGKQPIKNSIAVLPEIYTESTFQCLGICSDYIKNYN